MRRLFSFAATAVFLSSLLSCTGPGGEVQEKLSLVIYRTMAPGTADSQFIAVVAPGEWTLDIDWGAETPWGSVSVSSGMGDKKNIVFRWEANEGERERQAVLTGTSRPGPGELLFLYP